MRSRSLEGYYAGFLSRAAAVVLDLVIVGVLTSALVFLLVAAMRLVGTSPQACRDVSTLRTSEVIACVTGTAGLSAVALLTTPLYYTLLWALVGQTIGQRIMGLRVLQLNGTDLGMVRSFVRFIAYIVCLSTLGIGFLWVLVDNRRMGWHDKLARTCVVYDWKAEQNERFVARVKGKFGRNRREPPPAPQTGS